MKPAYDCIIVGAGHNGLTAAAYLARAGRSVLVLERNSEPGGIAVTQEFFPGYRASILADGAGYLAPEIGRDLKLERHGLQILPAEALVFSPLPGGESLTIWQDTRRTAAEIARFSQQDASRYPEFVELMKKISGVVGALLGMTPPELPELSFADLRGMRPLLGPLNQLGRKNLAQLLRALPMPAADLLNEWFESPALKGAIAANGVRDISWGPLEAGTAYTLLYKWALSNCGLFRSAGTVRGGMGMLSAARASAGQAWGVEIRNGQEVAEICTENGQAVGVRMPSGEQIRGRVVLSNADPGTTFFKLLGPAGLQARFVRHLRNIKYRGSTARMHLALFGLPDFHALRGEDAALSLGGAIQIAPSINYLQRAYDSIKYGAFSRRPYLDMRIPTLADPDLAPSGHHVLSLTVKYAPYRLRGAGWEVQAGALAENVLDTLAEYAPAIREKIVGQKLLTPQDLERDFGLPEGNLNHGEMTLDQFFHMRPVPGWAGYRTPLGGLYLCGSGSHPGGGVTGLPGRGAALAVLADSA